MAYQSWLAVFFAAAIDLAVSMVWYGPLFGRRWMKLSRTRKKDLERLRKRSFWRSNSLRFSAAAVMSYILGVLVVSVGTSTWQGGAVLGLLLWLGVAVPILLNAAIRENRPVALYLINIGSYLVSFPLMGAVLAVMI